MSKVSFDTYIIKIANINNIYVFILIVNQME